MLPGSWAQADHDYAQIEAEFQALLDRSLEPRGPRSVIDILATQSVAANGLAVDVGCGDGQDALELAQRFGLHVIGIDPNPFTIASASERMTEQVTFQLGNAEALPLADRSVDLLWCKEVLMFADLDRAFGQFARVLRPDGIGLVYQVLSGPRMSEAEARQFWEVDLGYGEAHSVRPADIEAAIAMAGLHLRERIDFASEWGEYAQEHTGVAGRRLLHAARLLRDPERYMRAFGESAYRVMLGDCLWHVYRMIGKLTGVAFVFSHTTLESPRGG